MGVDCDGPFDGSITAVGTGLDCLRLPLSEQSSVPGSREQHETFLKGSWVSLRRIDPKMATARRLL